MRPTKMIINVQTGDIQNIEFTNDELIEMGWTYEGGELVPPPLPIVEETPAE